MACRRPDLVGGAGSGVVRGRSTAATSHRLAAELVDCHDDDLDGAQPAIHTVVVGRQPAMPTASPPRSRYTATQNWSGPTGSPAPPNAQWTGTTVHWTSPPTPAAASSATRATAGRTGRDPLVGMHHVDRRHALPDRRDHPLTWTLPARGVRFCGPDPPSRGPGPRRGLGSVRYSGSIRRRWRCPPGAGGPRRPCR